MKIQQVKRRKAKPADEKKSSAKESFWNKDISFKKKFGNKERADFYQQLYVLIDAGVDINSALSHLIVQTKQKFLKDLFGEIQQNLQRGISVHECMQRTGEFSNYETYSIKIGEESGKLLEVLDNLTEYFTEKVEQRREIIAAISYPILIINAALGAVFFMIFFIIPVFEGIFSRFGGELPALTQTVLGLSVFLRGNFLALLIGLIVGAFTISWLLKNDKAYAWFERVWLRLPYVGFFVRNSLMSKFTNSMGLLLGAKVPLVNALEMNQNMFRSLALKSAIDQSIHDLIKGMSFSESVARQQLFDSNFKIFITIGEESSRLEYFFKKLSKDYRNALKHQTSVLNTVLEPLLIIVLGAIVGVILISMYLPMFEISTQMSFPE